METVDERSAVVTAEELGVNCWHPKRFIEGPRCERIWLCNYPEKSRCQALKAEIDYIADRQRKLVSTYANLELRIRELQLMMQ